jgi:chitodextrinase
VTQRYSRHVRGAIVLLAGLAFTASANAAPPAVTATGDAASYSWALGDGATAEGPIVTHVYGVGNL